MQIQPASFAFTLLLGLLASVPFSGIDINLPALAATGAALGASPSDVGFTMSVFMLSLATTPLIYGPASDRYGRKPVVVFGLTLFVIGSLACAFAQSLPTLLEVLFGLIMALTITVGARLLTGSYYGQTIQIWSALLMAALLGAGMVYGVGVEPTPSVIASGIGESMWAASYSLFSVLSRITAQPAVLITSTFSPCFV